MLAQNILNFRTISRAIVAGALLFAMSACAENRAEVVQNYPPAPTSYFTVAVHPGDTLSEIADRYQVEEDDLIAMNDIYDRNMLAAGSDIRIPAYGQVPPHYLVWQTSYGYGYRHTKTKNHG